MNDSSVMQRIQGDMTAAMYDGQLAACAAVKPALPAINAAVDDAAA